MSQSWSSGSALPLSGGRRRRHRRGGQDAAPPAGGQIPGTESVAGQLKAAGQVASEISGGQLEGGRRRKMTAKKMVKKLHVLARQAKKLTLRLKKMKKHH